MSGKSSIKKITTIGLLNYFSSYKLSDGSLVNVQIMDTAGQERFKSINASYCRNADCCLLVYDISNLETFTDCKGYFNQLIKDKCKKDIKVILLGNKTDLENIRQVQPEDGANFSLQNNYIFMETSCLKNENVADAFETLIEITNRELIKKKNEKISTNNIKITNKNNENNKNENNKNENNKNENIRSQCIC